MDKHHEETSETLRDILALLNTFGEKYEDEQKMMPYRINLIDELHTDENAHSRILTKLLQYKTSDGQFKILESFIEYIKKKKTSFDCIKVEKPIITQEVKRIDLWIRDKNCAIIIENKVYGADDQPKQFARYIDITKQFKFKENQIYIVYLSDKDPDKQTWGKKYEEGFKDRYLRLTFRKDILTWLSRDVKPNVTFQDTLLSSALEQYIDYLNGIFYKRDKKMNKELQNFLCAELELGNDKVANFDSVTKKIQAASKLQTHLQMLHEDIVRKRFREWENEIKTNPKFSKLPFFSSYIFSDLNDKIRTGIEMNANDKIFYIQIVYDFEGKYFYYGIKRSDKNKDEIFEGIREEEKLFRKDDSDWWYASKYTSFENGYRRFETLFDKIIAKLVSEGSCDFSTEVPYYLREAPDFTPMLPG
ncbi:MAG: PD-(D/E)XK nuclease family protein [Bacteroidales bacterium]|jgi:hypothetical protein|nr:PD-(D/E)XK nuclease family protein [Bacteroidales bacterium]